MTHIRGSKTLITGAARGMGRIMARRFAAEGAEVLLVDREAAELEAAADEVRRAGGLARTYVHDLARREEVAALRQAVIGSVGRIDILVNNAAVVGGGRFEDIPEDKDRLTLDVNVAAVHWLTKDFLPDLKGAREGHLVQMASAAGFVGVPGQALYCASKWFVIGLSEAVRQELRRDGFRNVHVTVVCPSLVATGMFAGSRAPRLTPLLTPDYVAERVVAAVRANALYVREPRMVKVIPLLRELLPTRVVDFVMDRTGASDLMSTFQGRPS